MRHITVKGLMATHASFVVVDDESLIRRAVRSLLSPHGTVDEAASIAEARVLRRREWSAAVIDVRLGDGSGLDVLEAWRGEGCAAPAVIYAGAPDAAIHRRAAELNAQVVPKSGQPRELLAFVAEAIDAADAACSIALRTRVSACLTATETNVLLFALRGRPAAEYRAEKEVTIDTYKTQVKVLLHKVGHSGSLLSLVASLWKEQAERRSRSVSQH